MIGDVVKKLRRNKKIYQQDLADALSVSKSTVAMWETNKRTPSIFAQLYKIPKKYICFCASVQKHANFAYFCIFLLTFTPNWCIL